MEKKLRVKFKDFLSSGIKTKDKAVFQRVILLNGFSLLGLAINIVFGFLNIISGYPILGVFELIIFGIYLLNLIFLRKSKNIDLSVVIALFTTLVLIIVIFFAKGYSDSGFYWSALYPLLVIFLVDNKKWRFWLYSYFGAALLLFYLETSSQIELVLEPRNFLIWNLMIVAITGLGMFFRSQVDSSKEKIQDKNDKLSELVESVNQQKNLLNTVLDTIGSPIYTKGKSGKYEIVNESFAKEVYGSSKDDLVGKNDLEIKNHVTKEHKKEYYLKDLEFMILPNSTEEQAKFKMKDGRYHEVILNKTTINDSENDVVGMVGVITDITNIIKIQNEIQTEKKKFETILESIGDGVIVLDKNQKIILVNSVTEDLTGFSRDELVGKEYFKLIKFKSSETGRQLKGFVDRVYKTGKSTSMDRHTILEQKGGLEIPVGDSAAPIFNEDRQVIGCIIVFRDSTKEVEIDRSKTEFISVVSHQLKTPITSIKWMAQLLESSKDSLTKEQRETVTDIVEASKSMSDMINDLLDVSRIESGKKFAVVLQKADIIKVINEELEKVNLIASDKNIKLKVDNTIPKSDKVNIDPEKIGQVIHNLLTNAIKYSSPGSVVTIGHQSKTKSSVYYVEDKGLGIPKDSQKNIFEKFYRADNVKAAKDGPEGTGLGLFIAKNIMDGHGGKIWFESEEGKGSIFFLEVMK